VEKLIAVVAGKLLAAAALVAIVLLLGK